MCEINDILKKHTYGLYMKDFGKALRIWSLLHIT
jgi:hypothetical protein